MPAAPPSSARARGLADRPAAIPLPGNGWGRERMAQSGAADRTVAVVGAGLAGLACAEALAAAGRDVRVLEKSRGIGGRLATRRRDGAAFDHGAPAVTATGSAAFCALLGSWRAAGLLVSWPAAGPAALVATPGMSALARPLADGLGIETERTVTGIAETPLGWRLECEPGEPVEVGSLALAIPVAQARALLGSRAARFAGLDAASMEPCWTLMVRFAAPVEAGSAMLEGDGTPLALAIADGAKPGRETGETGWVLHAGPEWSVAHLEDPRSDVAAALLAAFAARIGRPLPEARLTMVHRWRYARTARPLGRPCLWDGTARIGLAGDWCLGRDAGDAWQSGRALAERILAG